LASAEQEALIVHLTMQNLVGSVTVVFEETQEESFQIVVFAEAAAERLSSRT
jgi:hypothetical protein